MANYSKIKTFDIANGNGIRTSIFFSGCEFYCKGCFNSEIWNFNVGAPFTEEVYKVKIKPTITEHIAGISILGGEPLHCKNIEATYNLVNWFKRDFPNKTIWLWTGYMYEDLINIEVDILKYIDVLVDGKFVEEQKDLNLAFRGSKNQRVIDVKKTLEANEIVLYN